MYRLTLRRAAAPTAGFSSAAFTGDSSDAGARLRAEQARLRAEHTDNSNEDESNPNNNNSMNSDSSHSPIPPFDAQNFQHSNKVRYSADSAYYASFSDTHAKDNNAEKETETPKTVATDTNRPTRKLYDSMSDEALLHLFHEREQQVRQLRAVYEQFHYYCDKNYRKMIFDYHDKAAQLSQVHGRMQAASLQINREALKQMREQQEMYERDKRLVFFMSGLVVFLFWIWVRRHYIAKKEVLLDYDQVNRENLANKDGPSYVDATYERMKHSSPITGIGSYDWNFFSSSKRSGRTWETTWEKEVRERREKAYREKMAAQQQQQQQQQEGEQQPQTEKEEKKKKA